MQNLDVQQVTTRVDVCNLDGHTVDCLQQVWNWMSGQTHRMPDCVRALATWKPAPAPLTVTDPESIFNDDTPGTVNLFS